MIECKEKREEDKTPIAGGAEEERDEKKHLKENESRERKWLGLIPHSEDAKSVLGTEDARKYMIPIEWIYRV